MEFTTAATLLQLTAGGLGMLGSGADPTSTAIFETYEMVQVLNQRIANMEIALTDIYEEIAMLPSEFRKELMSQEERRLESELQEAMTIQATNYWSFVDSLASDNLEVTEEIYMEDILRNYGQLIEKLEAVLNRAPLGLRSALQAAAIEMHLSLRRGTPPAAVQNVARSRYRSIQRQLEEPVQARIDAAAADVASAEQAIDVSLGAVTWRTRNEVVDAEVSYISRVIDEIGSHRAFGSKTSVPSLTLATCSPGFDRGRPGRGVRGRGCRWPTWSR